VRGDLLDLFLAEHGTEVVERGAVGDPGAEQPRDVVGHHRLGAVAPPALADLAEVLKHRQNLHALAGRGRGDLAQVRQRRDVGRLVEAQKQRRVDRPPGPRAAREGLLDDRVDQRREQAAEAVLVVRRRGQVQRVGRVQQPRGIDPAGAAGGARDARLKPRVKRRLERGDHRRAVAAVAVLQAEQDVERDVGAVGAAGRQHVGDLVDGALGLQPRQPAQDLAHRA